MSRARTIANFGDGLVTADLPSDLGIVGGDLPTGSVLQVVRGSSTTQTNTTSSTYANLGSLDTSITPQFASSKILVFMTVSVHGDADADPQNVEGQFKLIRTLNGDTDLYETAIFVVARGGRVDHAPLTFNYLDSPNTTSSTSYRFFFRRNGGDRGLYINRTELGSVVLMEIAG